MRATGEDEPIIRPLPFGQLRRDHPNLAEPVIDGLLRKGETANVIAPPKVGKSWLTNGLALSVISGRDWLGYFPCRRGRVLLIDNELHPATIASRIPAVADGMAIREAEYADGLDVVLLRGRLLDLVGIGRQIVAGITSRDYAAVILDAKYRAELGPENENDSQRDFYNLIDQFAALTGAAWVLVHHSSKGSQADKSTVDVGAGGGAQARAADTHIVLREHEEPGCYVLDAAVRSFPPVPSIPLRWTFPTWGVDSQLNPEALKRPVTRGQANQDSRDRETAQAIREAMESSGRPMSRGAIRKSTGFSDQRTARGINALLATGEIVISETIEHPNGSSYDVFQVC